MAEPLCLEIVASWEPIYNNVIVICTVQISCVATNTHTQPAVYFLQNYRMFLCLSQGSNFTDTNYICDLL